MTKQIKQPYFIKHFFAGFAILLLFSILSCNRTEEFPAGKTIICDAEQLNKKGDKFVAQNDSASFFDAGKQRTDITSFTGKYSALTIPKKKAFAFGHTIERAGSDWYFKISVWRKSKDGKGVLTSSGKDPRKFYTATSQPVLKRSDGWEKLELELYTPPFFNNDPVTFYVWNNGTDTIYFDDFVIERLERKEYPEYTETPISIILDTSEFIKISEKRKEAFEKGVLQTSGDSWAKAIVFGDNNMMKARLRLKGDWLDHLRGDKWSFRIKMRKGFSWNRLRTFSVQTPLSRDFLREWEAHQFFSSQDILTTRYGFIPLLLNNQSRGMYAWEEHFDKQLLEWRQRREGPILKFTEDAFWQMQRNNINLTDKWRSLPFYEATVIVPFKESKTVRTPGLFGQFLNGQKLMFQYKNVLAAPEKIFDIQKMAAYFAMMDLMKISHGKAWHNQRFYFNPVLCKLEPIAFDGYSDHSVFPEGIESSTAYMSLNSDGEVLKESILFYKLFTDSVFVEFYLASLAEISQTEYIAEMKQGLQPYLKNHDSLLKLEFPRYYYDDDFIAENAKEIREYLPELERLVAENMYSENHQFKVDKTVYNDTLVIEGTPELLLNAYLQETLGDTVLIRVFNYCHRDIVLLGTGKKGKYIDDYLHPEPEMKAYLGNEEILIDITADSGINFLFFMIKGRFETYKVPIYQWPVPAGKTSQQELMEFVNMNNNPLFENISGNDIYIKTGTLTTNKPFIIPKGYKVHFAAGTTIDFVEGAMFISYSPVYMSGTEEQPIVITSSDFSANGFTILQAGERSKLENVHFENMNTLDYKGWTLTGAVTFYESDVDIVNTTFYRNQCEDALNTIRSDFFVDRSNFEYIFGDAFDSDFCTGTVNETTFKTIGNDAIDFSGSRIRIANVLIEDTEDKGISGGEESFLSVENTIIKRSGIGVASKDLSMVEFNNGEIIDCTYGLVLLQKKAEYGPATVIINNSKIKNPETEMLIELGSEVVIDGITIKGKKKKLSDIFYK